MTKEETLSLLKNSIKFLVVIGFVFISSFSKCLAQEYGTGILLDDPKLDKVPKSTPLSRSDYIELPISFSFKMFSPSPGSQGPFSTCAGWACGYGGKTILTSISHRWYKELVDSNVYSPSFIYNQIRKDSSCESLTSLVDALDVLKNVGNLKFNQFGYDCNREVTESEINEASSNKILDYRAIFNRYSKDKSLATKKSIVEYKPVIIAMESPNSFHSVSDVWTPEKTDYTKSHDGHGVVVIGYDDNKYGGAFQILNSWGQEWGEDGFGWVRYSDFERFMLYGFELIDNLKISSNEDDLSGSLVFRDANGKIMETINSGSYLKMKKSYPEGTLFELHLSNYQPAYVYAISADLNNNIYPIFPIDESISPLLPYKSNNIILPSEDSYYEIDSASTNSFYCFLYSNKELNIETIINQIKKADGSFIERLKNSLVDDLVNPENIKYKASKQIEFKAMSRGKSVVPVVVEFNHLN